MESMPVAATQPRGTAPARPERRRARPSFDAAAIGATRVRRPRAGSGLVASGGQAVLVGRACRRSDRAEVVIVQSPRTMGSVVL